jgi:hypothetical protein
MWKPKHPPFAPPAANDNRDYRTEPTGAYFYLLRVRADLLTDRVDRMTRDYYARWRAAVSEVESLMAQVRPFL